MSDNQEKILFPYDRIYFVGDSLMSTIQTQLEFYPTFAGVYTATVIEEVPRRQTYHQCRFSNDKGFIDHFADKMQGSNDHIFNFAYPGAGSNSNFLTLISPEFCELGIKENNLWWLTSSFDYKRHPGINVQFDRIVSEQHNKNETYQVFNWGNGAHNDFMSLTYLTGYKNNWTTMPQMTNTEIKQLERGLNAVASLSADNLKKNITRLYDIGIKDFVFVNAMPIHITPFFTDLKKRHEAVDGFAGFIDSMSTIYNNHLDQAITSLQQEYTSQNKVINLIYIKCQDINLPTDLKSVSFVSAMGKRLGKDFVLSQATNDEKQILATTYFFDHIHLTSLGYEFMTDFIVSQIKQKDSKLQAYYAQQPALNKPENSSYAQRDKYLFVMTQNSSKGIVR